MIFLHRFKVLEKSKPSGYAVKKGIRFCIAVNADKNEEREVFYFRTTDVELFDSLSIGGEYHGEFNVKTETHNRIPICTLNLIKAAVRPYTTHLKGM